MTSHVPIIFVDIDGTLSDNSNRAATLGLTFGSGPDWSHDDWLAYDAAADNDPPIPYMVEFIRTLFLSYQIFLVTGRHDAAVDITAEWLARYDVPYEELLMRPENDLRSNVDIKLAYLDEVQKTGGEVVLIIDDHPGVIAAYAARGIKGLWHSDPATQHGY